MNTRNGPGVKSEVSIARKNPANGLLAPRKGWTNINRNLKIIEQRLFD